jgi:hypothetical protein
MYDDELADVLAGVSEDRLLFDARAGRLIHTRPDGGTTPIFTTAHELRSLMQLLLLLDAQPIPRPHLRPPLYEGAALLVDLLDRNPVHGVLGMAHLRAAARGDRAVAVAFGGSWEPGGTEEGEDEVSADDCALEEFGC